MVCDQENSPKRTILLAEAIHYCEDSDIHMTNVEIADNAAPGGMDNQVIHDDGHRGVMSLAIRIHD